MVLSDGRSELQLTIPAAGVDVTIAPPPPFQMASLGYGGLPTGSVWKGNDLSYVAYGVWGQRLWGAVPNLSAPASVTAYVYGRETLSSAMPTSGSASYVGFTKGHVLGPTAGQVMTRLLSGDVALTANFETGGIVGQLFRMWAEDTPVDGEFGPEAWNDVSISASIISGTSKFAGTTSSLSAPDSAYALKDGASGSIDGGFYGPTGENLGAVWSLSDGNGVAVGAIGAQRQ